MTKILGDGAISKAIEHHEKETNAIDRQTDGGQLTE